MNFRLLHQPLSGIITLLVLVSLSQRAFCTPIPLTGCWSVQTGNETQDNQYYPPFQDTFTKAAFPLQMMNFALDSAKSVILLVEDTNPLFRMSLPAGSDTIYSTTNIQTFKITTPFAPEDSLKIFDNATEPGVGFPIIRLLTEAEWSSYLDAGPTPFRSISKIPVFNRFTHATYDLELHRFENFRRWLQFDAKDPLAVADFFKSISFTIEVDGEVLSLPLDAVLTNIDYEPGTGILNIKYLLSDDNTLSLTACAPASYEDPIFLIIAEITRHDGQIMTINSHWELDRPDIAFIDRDLPDQPNLIRHLIVFAHSSESIKIARRYCEIFANNPDKMLNRERAWWASWHRLDLQPAGLSLQQADLWKQSLTFLEINPLPTDSTLTVDHSLFRAWGLNLGGHADEAYDALNQVLNQKRETMTMLEWAKLLPLADLISHQVGHFQLFKSNWEYLLSGFNEPMIAQFDAYLQSDSLTAEHLFLLAAISTMKEIASGLGFPATAYVYQRLHQQFITALSQKLTATDISDRVDLLPGFLWVPNMLEANPIIYQTLLLNNHDFGRFSTNETSAQSKISNDLQLLILEKMGGIKAETVLTKSLPITVQATINAHLFPKYWGNDAYKSGPDLSPQLLMSYLLLCSPEEQ